MKNLILILIITALSYSFTVAQNPCPGTPTITYGNKIYNTVQIGTQCWLKENLDVGKMILGNQEQINNGIQEKYCYNDSLVNCTKYGGLYQWGEAVQYKNGASNGSSSNPAFSGNIQGICPIGWHIPTQAEFEILKAEVNGNGNALKDIGQGIGKGAGTNSSGFSALLVGFRNPFGPQYNNLGHFAEICGLTEFSNYNVYNLRIWYNGTYMDYDNLKKNYGVSIRCIKDETGTNIETGSNNFSKDYSLSQNYPNPFNPITNISFNITEMGKVTLKVFDSLGKEVAVLVNEFKQPGNYNTSFNASSLSSGVYYYQLSSNNNVQTKKLLLLK